MSDKNEPAFPCHPAQNPDGYGSGLTKREYFAAMAMQGLYCDEFPTARHIAEAAVRFADALLAELEKTK